MEGYVHFSGWIHNEFREHRRRLPLEKIREKIHVSFSLERSRLSLLLYTIRIRLGDFNALKKFNYMM